MTTLRPWVLAASLLCGLPAGAAIRIVDDDSLCPGSGSAADPYCSIQTAVTAAATTGDTILVRPGTYQECINALNPTPKTIVLEAEDPNPALTVIDGASCFSVSTVVLGMGSTITGFRMVGGREGAIASFGSVVITNNVIVGNLANESGGGIFADSAIETYAGTATINIQIEGNTLQGNSSQRDGGGIWVGSRSAGNVNSVALIQQNTVTGNDAAGVGGGIAGLTDAGFGSSASLRIRQNIVQANVVAAPANVPSDGFGGGIWVSTAGPGVETLTIDGNTLGAPAGSTNDALANTATKNGGGISATIFAVDTADHALFIETNDVRRNSADRDAGGIEVFVLGDSLDLASNPTPGRYSVLIANNDVDHNAAGNAATPSTAFGYGGGILADVGTLGTVSRRNPTDIVGNTITNNTASAGGGGAEARSFAEGGPPTFCAVTVRHNTVSGNSAANADPDPDVDGFGGGLSLFTQADGAGIARIDAAYNTITGNTAEVGGGGIDVAGVTSTASGGNGTTLIEISNSRIENNTGWGVGAPPDPGYPGVFRVTLRSSDLTPNSEGTVETTLNTKRVDVCMPASSAEELAFPGIDSDGDVDGVDLLRVATAFASVPGAPHYSPLADLDGDLVVDGNDLATLGASFGDTCP